jgi:hypothetical protein
MSLWVVTLRSVPPVIVDSTFLGHLALSQTVHVTLCVVCLSSTAGRTQVCSTSFLFVSLFVCNLILGFFFLLFIYLLIILSCICSSLILRRELLLMVLDALQKWSLIDVFVLIMMLVAFRYPVVDSFCCSFFGLFFSSPRHYFFIQVLTRFVRMCYLDFYCSHS